MIFLDNASTTIVSENVINKMNEYNRCNFFNPSAKYVQSLNVSKDINLVRKKILDTVNADSFKVVFTSGATEANNMALLSGLRSGKELIVSEGEHSSIYEFAKQLENGGKVVHFIKLNPDGTIDAERLIRCINNNTGMVSIIHTSNETGAINDIKRITMEIKKINPNIIVHSDLVQSFCKIDLDIENLGIDMATISSHKIHGPKGIGALIAKKKMHLKPLVFGGGQEGGDRSGTENVPGIIGFGVAVEELSRSIEKNYTYVRTLKDCLIIELEKVLGITQKFKVNGSTSNSPYIVSLSFDNIRGEVLLHELEKYGVLVGTGSACSSHVKGNRVLMSMGKTKTETDGNIRISFSYDTKIEEVKMCVNAIKNALIKLKN